MVTPQLLDYIRQQLVAGVSKEEIIQSLITTGWQGQDINDAFSTIGTQSALPQIQKAPAATFIQSTVTQNDRARGRKRWLVILIVLLLIVVGAVLAYFAFYKNSAGVWSWTDHTFTDSPNLFAVSSSADGTHLAIVDGAGKIYISIDSGATWTVHPDGGLSVASSADGTHLATSEQGNNMYTSSDSGVTWAAHAAGDQYGFGGSITSSSDGTHLAAIGGTGGNVLTSSDSGATWVSHDINVKSAYRALADHIASSADGTHLIVNDSSNPGFIYTSPDFGVTWTVHSINGAGPDLYGITSSADGTHLAVSDAGTGEGGYIYTSSASGVTWTAQTDVGRLEWVSIASSADGTHLAALDVNGHIHVSSDFGITWTQIAVQSNVDKSQQWAGIASSAEGTHLAVITARGDVWTGVLDSTK
ncbi:MAG: WD40/YVTN/BNR-like repeat-containing protein [Minisyncoccota bacterium]